MKYTKLTFALSLVTALGIATSCKKQEEAKVLTDEKVALIEKKLNLPKAESPGVYSPGEAHDIKIVTHSIKVVAEDGYKSTWAGSEKEIRLKRDYIIHMGFIPGRELRLKEIGLGMIEIQGLGEFKIISPEPVGEPSFSENGGYWNRITDKEKLKILSELHESFKKQLKDENYAAQFAEEAYDSLMHSMELESDKVNFQPLP